MPVHENSLAAYHSLDLAPRLSAVLNVYLASLCPLTDREVKEMLGLEDMNTTRPRVSELIDSGLLEEVGNKQRDHVTGKKVRVCQPTARAIELSRAKQ
jgi:predicted HTH transcriptional regulator